MIIEFKDHDLYFNSLKYGEICEYCNHPTNEKFIGMKISVDGKDVILNLETYRMVDFGLHYMTRLFDNARLVL